VKSSRVGGVLVACGLLLGACGGDESAKQKGGAPAGPHPSKAEFIARADRVCADVNRRGRRLERRKPRTPAELVRAAGATTDLLREAVRRLEAIGVPAGGAGAGAKRFVDSAKLLTDPLKRLERSAKRLRSAVAAKSRDRVQTAVLDLQEALIDLQQANRKNTKIAKRYGMKDCGEEEPQEERTPRSPSESKEKA
jgi:hypothetical protein